jgi:PII-like signaling protein
VSNDCLKLTIYYGEHDRAGGRFLGDALVDVFARYELQTSLLLRGAAGFGAKQHLRTDRQLTLSEDLPLVSVAVDTPARIRSALAEIEPLRFDGLVTLERARLLTGALTAIEPPGEQAKLTVYVGRRERAGARPAYEAVVELLHRRGIAGATVLLGVDGTVHGVRRRARFLGRNADVPLMVISVGDGARIAAVLPELAPLLRRPLVTLERVRIGPAEVPATDAAGAPLWQKLMVYASEQSLYLELVRRLRRAGAAGVTSLRGIWGYHGDRPPHGDSVWQLRRHVPMITVVVDTPANIRRWFAIVDELAGRVGLVTTEVVPAYRATGPGIATGGLRLAERLEREP